MIPNNLARRIQSLFFILYSNDFNREFSLNVVNHILIAKYILPKVNLTTTRNFDPLGLMARDKLVLEVKITVTYQHLSLLINWRRQTWGVTALPKET
jgi:hypothetical protein